MTDATDVPYVLLHLLLFFVPSAKRTSLLQLIRQPYWYDQGVWSNDCDDSRDARIYFLISESPTSLKTALLSLIYPLKQGFWQKKYKKKTSSSLVAFVFYQTYLVLHKNYGIQTIIE